MTVNVVTKLTTPVEGLFNRSYYKGMTRMKRFVIPSFSYKHLYNNLNKFEFLLTKIYHS